MAPEPMSRVLLLQKEEVLIFYDPWDNAILLKAMVRDSDLGMTMTCVRPLWCPEFGYLPAFDVLPDYVREQIKMFLNHTHKYFNTQR